MCVLGKNTTQVFQLFNSESRQQLMHKIEANAIDAKLTGLNEKKRSIP
jgi:hypothetical protein